MKLASFKISYLKQRKWWALLLMNTFCVKNMSNDHLFSNKCFISTWKFSTIKPILHHVNYIMQLSPDCSRLPRSIGLGVVVVEVDVVVVGGNVGSVPGLSHWGFQCVSSTIGFRWNGDLCIILKYALANSCRKNVLFRANDSTCRRKDTICMNNLANATDKGNPLQTNQIRRCHAWKCNQRTLAVKLQNKICIVTINLQGSETNVNSRYLLSRF